MAKISLSIGFAPHLVPLIKNGTKQLTYRIGDKYGFLAVGDKIAVRDSSTNEVFGEIEIIERSYTTFKNLPLNRAGHEIYKSKEEQKEIFSKYYAEVHDADKVLILGFTFSPRL